MDLHEYAASKILNGEYLLRNKWVTENKQLKSFAAELFPSSINTFQILTPRQGERVKHQVLISSVEGTPFKDIYDTSNTRVYVGGPGSMVGAALDSILSHEGMCKGPVVYLNDDFQCSNFRSSAYYYHIRHSCALNSEYEFRARTVLARAALRSFQSRTKLLLDAQKLKFWKIDLTMQGILGRGFTAALATSAVMLGLVWHTAKNSALEKIGRSMDTDWVRNRIYSKASTPILQFLETKAATLLPVNSNKYCLLQGLQRDGSIDGYGDSIHITIDEAQDKNVKLQNSHLRKSDNIMSRKLQDDEVEQIMGGPCDQVYGAYLYQGDGRVSTDIGRVLSCIVSATGNTWKDNVVVEKVFVDEKSVRGLQYRDKQSNELEYLPCTGAVLSLGYTSKYKIDTQRFDLTMRKYNPAGFLTPGAGCSGYALIKGRIPAISTQFSHWTMMEYSPVANVSLCKLTAGGNIGSEYAQMTYVLNLLQQTKSLFGSRLIGVLSIESCPRVLNSQNDVQFYRFSDRFHVAVGLGGTGVTKMGANGMLSVLLSNPHLSKSSLINIDPRLFGDVDLTKFVTDRSRIVWKGLT